MGRMLSCLLGLDAEWRYEERDREDERGSMHPLPPAPAFDSYTLITWGDHRQCSDPLILISLGAMPRCPRCRKPGRKMISHDLFASGPLRSLIVSGHSQPDQPPTVMPMQSVESPPPVDDTGTSFHSCLPQLRLHRRSRGLRWGFVGRRAKMRGNLPGIAPPVLHRGATVTIRKVRGRFQRLGASLDGALVRLIGVVDIDVQEGRSRAADAGVANHDDRVPDPQGGWHLLPIISRRGKHVLDERDQFLRLVSNDSWRHGVPAIRDKVAALASFAHRGSPRSIYQSAADSITARGIGLPRQDLPV